MTALAHNAGALEIRGVELRTHRARGPKHLVLRASGDGWSLIDARGEVVFRGLGIRSRHECLEFARDRGVLAVFTT